MAKVIHTCTGCVPIDASIVEVYTRLIATEARAEAAAEHAEQASAGKAPYIGENGNWWEWDNDQNAFVDTGVQASTGMEVDDHMSDTSTNPVQNKVVKEYIDEHTASDPDAVKYTEQSLTDPQRAQARENIGAAALSAVNTALASLESAVTAKYSKPASGIPETDMDAAVQSALALARTAVQSLSDYYTKAQVDDITAAIAASVNSTSGEVVTSLPSAGAGTLGKIYYVGPDGSGFYDRYVTSYDGSTYSWLALGNTEVDMTQYATVEQLNQLEHNFSDISETTKNIFFGTLSNGNIDASGVVYDTPDNFLHCDEYIPVAVSEGYVISAELVSGSKCSQIVLLEYAVDKSVVTRSSISSGSELASRSATFTTGATTKYIKFLLYSANAIDGEGTKVQIEKGSVVTEYTPHWTAKDDVARNAIIDAVVGMEGQVNDAKAKSDAAVDLAGLIAPGLADKYLLDGATWESGKYVDPVSGNLANNDIYSASSFVEIQGATDYRITKGTMLYGAFYDDAKTFISGIKNEAPATSAIDVASPAAAKYVRLSGITTEISAMSLSTKGDVYLNPAIKIGKTTTIRVALDGSKDYTSLRAAFAAIQGSSDYNRFIVEYYGDGSEYDITGDFSNTELTTIAGLTIPAYTTLIGMGGPEKCVLAARLTASQANRYFSAINMTPSSCMKNITVIGVNTRNVLHNDTQPLDVVECVCENCIFEGTTLNLKYVAATGLWDGCKMVFRDCIFKAFTSGDYAFSCHNNVGFSQQADVILENCRFYATVTDFSVRLGSLTTGANGVNCICRIVGCRIPTQLRLNEEAAQAYGSGCLWKVTGYANDIDDVHIYTTDGQDYSGNINLLD